jgi:hypothetical protein
VPLAAPRTTPLAVTPDAPTRELDPNAAAGAPAPPSGHRQPAGAEIAARRRARWLLPAIALVVLALVVAGIARGVGTRGAGQGSAATVEVPNLVGASLGTAYRQIFDRGLVPGRVDVAPGPGQPGNVVVYQAPAPGQRVQRGTAVDLVLRTAP